jgi:hypothetical protein
MTTRWHEDDIDGLDDLEEQLRALKREEELLCDVSSNATGTPEILELQKVANAGPDFPLHRADCRPSYSAVDPLKGDVRGYKRAQLIRRVGAVLALSLAVISAITVTSSGEIESDSSNLLQKVQQQQMLASAADVVLEALERDSSTLSPSEKQLFQNRYEHLLDSERRHENWDMERAAHLVHKIDAASVQNLKVSILKKKLFSYFPLMDFFRIGKRGTSPMSRLHAIARILLRGERTATKSWSKTLAIGVSSTCLSMCSSSCWLTVPPLHTGK